MDYAPSPAKDSSASHIGHMNRPSPRSAFEARPSRTQIAPAKPDAIYSESRRDAGVTTLVASESFVPRLVGLATAFSTGWCTRPPAPHSPMRRGG